MVRNPPASAGEAGSIPGSGRSPGGGNGNPLQYACLENPMDGGAWWATGQGVARVRHDRVTNEQRRQTSVKCGPAPLSAPHRLSGSVMSSPRKAGRDNPNPPPHRSALPIRSHLPSVTRPAEGESIIYLLLRCSKED